MLWAGVAVLPQLRILPAEHDLALVAFEAGDTRFEHTWLVEDEFSLLMYVHLALVVEV